MRVAHRPLPELVDFVGGVKRTPSLALERAIHDPNTGEVLQAQRATDDTTLDDVMALARDEHRRGHFRSLDLETRARALEAVATRLDAQRDTLAFLDAQTTGVVISLTTSLAEITAHAFRVAAAELRKGCMRATYPGPHGEVELVRKPLGPVAIIAPWNAPTPITAHKLASALAAGCPVVMKPSEWSPHSCDVLAQAVLDAGLPPGIVQVVHGASRVGGRCVKAPEIRAVSFTGGLVAGRAVAEECARQLKPVQLELGGNNALVVLEDADVERAAAGVVTALTTLNAQWCRALGRLIVHESLHDVLLERTLARLAQIKLGSSLDPESEMGPLVHGGHLAMLRERIALLVSQGGRLHASTKLPALAGHFLAPTLITGVAPELALEELFGPVATVHTFGDEAEALMLANQAPYGLAGYVFSRDEARAFAFGRQLETGMVKINGVTLLGLSPDAPRPAWKQSGLGHEGARATIEFFCGETVVGVAAR